MISYRDFDINNAILAFTETKEEPRFLDMLQHNPLEVGDEVVVTIELKGKTNHKIQFNRTITNIKEDEKKVNTSDKGEVTFVGLDYILE